MPSIQSVNPATGRGIRVYKQFKPAQVALVLKKTHAAQHVWAQTDLARRTAVLDKAAEVLRAGAARYARLIVSEMGKPLREAQREVEKCARGCEYYRDHAAEFLQPQTIASDAAKSYVSFEPLGVLLAVMPWNFPLWQIFRACVPALAAGNGVVLKPASNTTGCGLAAEEVFREAGAPKDLFRTLILPGSRLEPVIGDHAIAAVTLTGSVAAGQAVAAQAGRHLKKTVLELGGSDPYVVLADADLEQAAQACVTARLINAGQSCVAAKRFVVTKKVYAAFEKLVVEAMKAQKVGDPMDPATTIGPLARADLRKDLHRQVQQSVRKGARLLLGGRVPEGSGSYYPPTVLAGVQSGMPAYDEEIFGPVVALIRVADEAEAIRVANDTCFGLGAAVFTKDVARGEAIAREQLKTGMAFVNAYVRSDPRLPFGGVRASGYGRELAGFGIKEFVNAKTVYVR